MNLGFQFLFKLKAVNDPYLPSDMQDTRQMAYCIDPILLVYDYKIYIFFVRLSLN